MKSLKNWFVKEAPPERRGAERVRSPWLVANQFGGAESKKHNIRDISSTGVFLLTEDRWQPGELVSIALRRKDEPELSPNQGIPVQVRAVRWDKDGVALCFVEAKDMDLNLGEGPLADTGERKEPEEVRRKFRMAKASAFVDRICPSVSEDVKVLLRDRLSTVRVGNALDIALKAESLLGSVSDTKRRAHPKIVMSILESGSWADEEATHQLWAGFLVSCCTEELQDESSPEFARALDFIRMLLDLAPDHVRIFEAACARATVVVSECGATCTQPVFFTLEELLKVTGMQHQFYRIDVDIDHLVVFGLLKDRVKASSYTESTRMEATPTDLALELYASCHGYRGEPQGFYGLAAHSPVA